MSSVVSFKLTRYVCVKCNRKIELDSRKPILCYHCGGRVLQKLATKKPVQLVAR